MRPGQVDVHQPCIIGFLGLEKVLALARCDTRVVDKEVQSAEVTADLLQDVVARLGVPDIPRQ